MQKSASQTAFIGAATALTILASTSPAVLAAEKSERTSQESSNLVSVVSFKGSNQDSMSGTILGASVDSLGLTTLVVTSGQYSDSFFLKWDDNALQKISAGSKS